jgi:hypothetical protein
MWRFTVRSDDHEGEIDAGCWILDAGFRILTSGY